MMQPTKRSEDVCHGLEQVLAPYDPLRIRYAPGELLFQAGCFAAGVYLINDGIVQESYAHPAAGEPEVATGLFGRPSLLGHETFEPGRHPLHGVSCRAVTWVSVLFVEQAAFETAVAASDPLRAFQTSHLLERQSALTRALWRSQLDPAGRIRATLQEIIPFCQATEDGGVLLPAEIDLHRLAELSYVSYRKTRDLLRSQWQMEQQDEGWMLSPARRGSGADDKRCATTSPR